MDRIKDISEDGAEEAYKYVNILRNEFNNDFENEINKNVSFQSLLIKLFDALENDIINNTNTINVLQTQDQDFIKAKDNKTFSQFSNSIMLRVHKNSKLGKDIGLSEIKFLKEETKKYLQKLI